MKVKSGALLFCVRVAGGVVVAERVKVGVFDLRGRVGVSVG